MEFIKHDPSLGSGPLPQDRPKELDYSSWDVVKSAFNENSDVAAVVQWGMKPSFEDDPNFDVYEAAKKSPLFENYAENLGRARSQAEMDFIQADILSELRDKQVLASSGFGGFVASAVAGLLSPVTLIPFAGPARGLKGVAQSFALAAAASSAQELTLYGLSETRTEGELALGIGAGTILGGLLGSAGMMLSPVARVRAASGMDLKRGKMTILQADEAGAMRQLDFDTIRTIEEVDETTGAITVKEEAIPPEEMVAEVAEDFDTPVAPLVREAPEEVKVTPQEIAKAPEAERALVRQRAKGNEAMEYGGSYLRGTLPNGYQVIFTKATGGTKWFVGGEYAINIINREGKDITPVNSATSHRLAGRTSFERQAELKEAFMAGQLDSQILDMLEFAGEKVARNDLGESTVGAASARNRALGIERAGVTGKVGEKIAKGLDTLEAAQVPTMVGRAAKRAVVGVARAVTDPIGALAKLNPVTRQLENKLFPSARTWMARMHTAGLKIKTSDPLNPIAEGGSMYDRRSVHQNLIGNFVRAYDDAFLKYITDGKASGSQWAAKLQVVKSNLNMVPPGKMNYKEFGEHVFRLGNTGEKADDPYVAEAVDAASSFFDSVNKIHEEYYNHRLAIDGAYDEELNPAGARKLYDELEFGEDSDVQKYFHHMFDTDYLARNPTEFLRDFGADIEQKLLGRFAASFEKFSAERTMLNDMKTILSSDEAGITRMFDQLDAARKQIDETYGFQLKQVKELRKAMNAAGASKEDINAAVKNLEASFGPEFGPAMKQRRQLDRQLGVLTKLGAGLSEKQTKVLTEIERLEDLQITELERVAREGAKVQDKINTLVQKGENEDGAFSKLWTRFVAAVKTEGAQQRKMDKLIDDIDAYDKLAETLEKTTARKEDLLKKIEGFKYTDAAEAKKLIDDAMNLYLTRIKELQGKRAVRVNRLKERAKELDPDARGKMRLEELKKVQGQLDEIDEAFQQSWRQRGAEDINLEEGTANFKNQADADAKELYIRLSGTPLRVSGIEVLGGKRGAQLQRYLNIPFDIKQKYLVRDPETVIRAFAHSTFPDFELYRATGSVNGARMIDDINMDYERQLTKIGSYTHMYQGKPVNRGALTPEQLAKARELTKQEKEEMAVALRDARDQTLRDFSGLIDRFRHQRGMPKNANGFGYRAGRIVANLNVTRLMGTVVPSSISELARPIFVKGVGTAFRNAWKPLIDDLPRVRHSRLEAYRAGIALDPLLHNRPQAFFDTADNFATRQTLAERGLETLANKTGFVALFDKWTAEVKHLSASVALTEISDAIRIVNTMNPNTREFVKALELLKRNNLGMDDSRRIWAQFNRPGGSSTFKHDVRLPNTEAWDDYEATMAFRTAVNKVADDLIVTPGLDRPLWVDENMAFRLLAQFKSFGFSATNRILMAGLQQPDAVFLQGAIFTLALGAISTYTWGVTAGGAAWEKVKGMSAGDWVYESVNRSGLLGILTEGQRLGEQIPALNDYAVFGGGARTSRQADDMIGALAGPSYGLAKRLAQVVQGLDNPSMSTLHAARVALVPYQNVFYLRRLIDQMEENIGGAFGLPDRRK